MWYDDLVMVIQAFKMIGERRKHKYFQLAANALSQVVGFYVTKPDKYHEVLNKYMPL